jgi:hypothetical protein
MPGRTRLAVAGAALLLLLPVGCSEGSATADAGAEGADADDTVIRDGVTILSPVNNEVVSQRFTVEIDPGDIDTTGESVPADAGGTFHVLVDQDCAAIGDPFPEGEDSGHFPFEQGETKVNVDLEPGAHELCVQFGNAFDLAFYAEDTTLITVG